MGKGKAPRGVVTLSDVAAAAGVSVITASRVVRGKGSVAPRTRDRVMQAVKATGYTPNPIAASLVSSASNLIGVIVPSLTSIVFLDVLNGINSSVASGGYRTIFAVSNFDEAEETRLVSSLLAWRPAALILTGVEHEPETVSRIKSSGIRCIELMDLTEEPIDIVVGHSNEDAGRQSARYLVKRGYRRIGYVGHAMDRDHRSRKRYHGFRDALAASGVNLRAEVITSKTPSVASGRSGLAELLARARDIDAVYFSNDDMAIGGTFHCYEAQIAIPDGVAIMGFNGLDVGQQLPKRLTTIKTRVSELGEIAGRAVLALAAGSNVAEIQNVGFDIITGETA